MADDAGALRESAQDSISHPRDKGGLSAPSPSPSGEAGTDTAVCRCGAGAHPEDPDRCAMGHMIRGNTAAVVAGERSAQFWREHAAARRELREQILADAGHEPDDAPEALRLAADSLAQATLVQQSAYLRMIEEGGPLSSKGRARRCFDVWIRATDRVERYARLVGLKRRSRKLSTAEALAAQPEVTQ